MVIFMYLLNLFRENRYLLFLTENYSALRILLQMSDLIDHDPLVLFGSSFPHDINYTQVTKYNPDVVLTILSFLNVCNLISGMQKHQSNKVLYGYRKDSYTS